MLEELSGARMTHSYVRVGGLAYDLPEGFDRQGARALAGHASCSRTIDDCSREPDLPRSHGRHRRHHAGATRSSTAGPVPACASTGVDYDVRKAHPYLVYDRFDFDVRSDRKGDNFDRYIVRMEEVRQSMRILEQALKQDPGRTGALDDPRIVAAAEAARCTTPIEGMIAHFKLIIDGVKVPPGEVYSYTEGGNGELGFYIVSDGSGRPYKCRVRAPCFIITSALQEMIVGATHRRHRADLRHDEHDRRRV